MADNYIGRVKLEDNTDSPLTVTTGKRLPGALTATIETSASLSSPVVIPDGWRIDSLGFGLGWLGKVSFQDSIDGGTTWRDLLENGESISETPHELCSVPLTADMSLRVSKSLIRIQSGVMGDITAQDSDQTIDISLISM